MWSRLIFPDGSSLVLDNLKDADQSGYSGFKGQVNRHWGSIISSALFVSLLGAGVELAAPTDNNRRNTKILALFSLKMPRQLSLKLSLKLFSVKQTVSPLLRLSQVTDL